MPHPIRAFLKYLRAEGIRLLKIKAKKEAEEKEEREAEREDAQPISADD